MNTAKNVKLFGMILGILLFIAIMAGLTYAWFMWRSSNISITGTSECFSVNHTKGDSITQTFDDAGVILFDESKIISDSKITIKEGMAITNVTASLDTSCNVNGELIISLSITSLNDAFTDTGDSTGAFKYVVASYDPSVYQTITVSELNGESFDIINSGSIASTDTIELASDGLTVDEKGYLIIFYIDGDLAFNNAQDSTFSGTITAAARSMTA